MAKSFTYNGKDYSFGRILPKLDAVKSQLPNVMATTALNFFKDSFRRQGWRDKGLQKWAGRKDGSRPGGAILVKRGHLRNSIRKIMASWPRTEVGTNLPYAAAHNQGFKGQVNVKSHTRRKYQRSASKRKEATGSYTVRAHTRNMNLGQRQFMGDSEMLNKKLDAVITKAVDNIFNV